MKIQIIRLTPQSNGDEAELTVSLSNGEQTEMRVMTVASRMLFELGNIGVGVLPYELDTEKFDKLEYYEELWRAVKIGLKLLSFTDSTKRRLAEKLTEREIDREIARDAVDYLESLGYVNESRRLERDVESLAAKGYGLTRIKQELYRKGYGRETLEGLDDIVGEIDFDEVLIGVLCKKCKVDRLCDRKYRESLIAAMYRLGHAPSAVREALKSLEEA